MLNSFLKYFSSSIIVLLISVFSFSYMTSVLSPEQYGELGLLLSLFSLLIPIVSLSANELLQVQFIKMEEGEYSKFYTSLLILILILTLLVYIVMFIVYQIYEFNYLVFLVPLLCLSRSIKMYAFLDMVIKKLPGLYGVANVGIAVITLMFTIVLFSDELFLVEKRVLALVIGEVVIMLYLISRMGYRLSFGSGRRFYTKILKYGLPGILASLPGWVLNESGRMSLISEGYLTNAGLYTVAMQFAIIFLQFNSSLGNAIAKKVLENVVLARSWAFNLKIYCLQIAGFFVYLLVFLLFKDILIDVKYSGINLIFSILLLGYLFQSMALVPDMVLSYFERSDLRLVALLLSSVVTFMCNYFLISEYKEVGGALGLGLGFLVYSISMHVASKYLLFVNKRTLK